MAAYLENYDILKMQDIKDVHDALMSRLAAFQIKRFQCLFLPPSSLYDEREVSFTAFGYEKYPHLFRAYRKAISKQCNIWRLRGLLKNMVTPVFGADSIFKAVMKDEDLPDMVSDKAVLRDGLLIPLYGPNGFVGMFGCSAKREDLTDKQIRELQLLCICVFQRYCELEIQRAPKTHSLTDREMQILRHMMQGKTNSEVADDIGISKHTVDGYIGRLFLKLQVNDRVSAAMKARDLGLHIVTNDISEPDGMFT